MSHAARCAFVVAVEHARRREDLGDDRLSLAAELSLARYCGCLGFEQCQGKTCEPRGRALIFADVTEARAKDVTRKRPAPSDASCRI
jgi:hypothetical protein